MSSEFKGRPTFHPMPGRVAVEPIEETVSGLILPPSKEKSVIGRVVALSEEIWQREDIDILVHIGDVVLFGANSGMTVEVGRGPTKCSAIFLRESEIISRVTWEEAHDA